MKTVDELKELLKTKKAKEINFKEFYLSGADLSGADLERADLYLAKLGAANLEGSLFNRAIFYQTEICDRNLEYLKEDFCKGFYQREG